MATNTETVSLLIGNVDAPQHYTDDQLAIFLDLANDGVYLATALALESWAATLADSAVSRG